MGWNKFISISNQRQVKSDTPKTNLIEKHLLI